MAVTFIDFQPSPSTPFQFQVVLTDLLGKTNQYNVVVTYNFFGQRYYVNIYTLQGALVVTRPMIGSPAGWDISLTAGYFTSTLVFRTSNNQFEVSPLPISYPAFGKYPDWMLDANLNKFITDQQVIA